MPMVETRLYQRRDVVSFRRTGEAFGGLSNMAPGFPVIVNGHSIKTVEALYQACRFPHLPEIQQMILDEASPMTAKMRSKPYRSQSRPDWDDVRVAVMKWVLRVKLAQNWTRFSALLLDTGDRPIVEDSRKDDFWGATTQDDDRFAGRNVLGRLLMELRDKLRVAPEMLENVDPVPIPDFLMLDEDIETIARVRHAPLSVAVSQPALL
ncbi:NADAR family protein [Sphingomonas sp. SUN039]|uniref:NADAR family protein n=1 Tax=Sphingomonas sp. SUN039 TaxID=2937787 RepID=UPI0021648CC2|nr:NADAR family protein [Sphingomonas sp. SUN039]UVO55921.1 NADAR family protein [Sphingomonas sp. SUN039]